MATTRAILIMVLSGCWAVGGPDGVQAQILSEPVPTSGEVRQVRAESSGGAEAGGVERVGWFNIPLPKITMPKLTLPKVTMPKMPPLWPSESNEGSPALLAPVASGFSKISAGAHKAWEGTKEVFAAGTEEKAPAAQAQPSFWQRLVGRSPQPEGPQTVGEFMSQPRLDP